PAPDRSCGTTRARRRAGGARRSSTPVSSLASWLPRAGEKVGDRQRARWSVSGKPPIQMLGALAGQEVHVHGVAAPDVDGIEAGVMQRPPQRRPRLLVHMHAALVLVAGVSR